MDFPLKAGELIPANEDAPRLSVSTTYLMFESVEKVKRDADNELAKCGTIVTKVMTAQFCVIPPMPEDSGKQASWIKRIPRETLRERPRSNNE